MLALENARPSNNGGKTILVVDDDKDILASLEAVIQIELPGVQVLTASSGARALEILRDRTIDLVITDYKMPGMNGIDLLRALERVDPRVRAMLISAFPQEVLKLENRPQNLACFIAKPLDVDHLLQEAQQCLGG